MPEAWRIVKVGHTVTAFSGEGAAQTGGRWNSRGVPVVYTSSTRSLAALETLVHLNPPVAFKYKIFRIAFSVDLIERLRHARLPSDWQAEPPPPSTQHIGDAWVREARSIVLAVPSVLIPEEINYVLNPAHRDFQKIRIAKPEDFRFDARLLT